MPAIRVQNLNKSFVISKRADGFWGTVRSLVKPNRESKVAVKDVSFEVQQGEIVGFLGPNGAGKTTTIKMLTGILYPTSGELSVLGYTPFDRKPEMLRNIALVMGNRQQLWWDLPAWESFVVLREIYDVPHADFDRRVHELVDALGLQDHIRTQVRKLSLGERMKCELVASLLHSPQVLFLDEPTIGLDLVSQKRIREFLKEYNRTTNCSIVLTSHYMQDVEELCERVIVIDHGSLVYDGTLAKLSESYSETKRLALTFAETPDLESLSHFGRIVTSEGESATLEVPRADLAAVTAQVLNQYAVTDISVADVEIEEVIANLFARPVSRETPSVD